MMLGNITSRASSKMEWLHASARSDDVIRWQELPRYEPAQKWDYNSTSQLSKSATNKNNSTLRALGNLLGSRVLLAPLGALYVAMCYYWSDSATHSTGPKISTFTQPNATATHRGTTDNLSNHIYCVLVKVVHVILAALVGVKSQHKLNRSGNVSSLCVRWNSKRARLESARLVEPACGILDGKCEHEDAQPLALARTHPDILHTRHVGQSHALQCTAAATHCTDLTNTNTNTNTNTVV